MANVKVGDVVVLKSGGPQMTVGYIDDNGRLSCRWFAGQDDRFVNSIDPAMVMKLENHDTEIVHPRECVAIPTKVEIKGKVNTK